MTTPITFRCPEDIDAVIKSQMEVTGQDKTAVIVSILRAGIQATLNDGVEISTRNTSKTDCKTVWEQSDLIATLRAELMAEVNQLVLDNLMDVRRDLYQFSKQLEQQMEQLEAKLPA